MGGSYMITCHWPRRIRGGEEGPAMEAKGATASFLVAVHIAVALVHAVLVGVCVRKLNNCPPDRPNPLVLLLLRLRVHKVGRVRGRDLKAVLLAGPLLGRLDGPC